MRVSPSPFFMSMSMVPLKCEPSTSDTDGAWMLPRRFPDSATKTERALCAVVEIVCLAQPEALTDWIRVWKVPTGKWLVDDHNKRPVLTAIFRSKLAARQRAQSERREVPV